MDFRACSCDNIRYKDYESAIERLADRIQLACSFKKAVGLVFRDSHPETPDRPSAPGCAPNVPETKKHCGGCTPHIAQLINEKGLRPDAEYKSWLEWHNNRPANCGDCAKDGLCSVTFDLSPR